MNYLNSTFVLKVPRLGLKKTPLQQIFLELPNNFLRQDFKPVSGLYGHRSQFKKINKEK
jgi:hypothetical protein